MTCRNWYTFRLVVIKGTARTGWRELQGWETGAAEVLAVALFFATDIDNAFLPYWTKGRAFR